jgi:hypothetical protein
MLDSRMMPATVLRMRSIVRQAESRCVDLIRIRWLLYGVCVAGCLPLTLVLWSDWHYYRDGAELLFSQHWAELYVLRPDIQIGPVALATVRVLLLTGPLAQSIWAVGTAVLFLPTAWLAERILGGPSVRLLLGTLIASPCWALTAVHGQGGDCLILFLAVLAVRLVQRDRALQAALAVGAAAAVKPWAAPLIVMLWAAGRRRWLAMGLAAVVLLAAYLPFTVADPATLHARLTQVRADPASLPYLLELGRGWIRPIQIAGGFLLTALMVARGRWRSSLVAVTAFRVMFDPSTLAYYLTGPLVGALLVPSPAVLALTCTPLLLSGQAGWMSPFRAVIFAALLAVLAGPASRRGVAGEPRVPLGATIGT